MDILAVGSIVREFEDEWNENHEPDFARFLSGKSILEQRVLLVELIRSSVELRARKGLPVDLHSYLQHYPELSLNPGDVLQLLYAEHQVHRNLGKDLDKSSLLKKYPGLATLIEDGFTDSTEAFHSQKIKEKSSLISMEAPQEIGHYRIEGILGRGSFGAVYLAVDTELNRKVAVKVPRPDRVYALRDLESYRNEARNLARLDQPGILPVLAVGFDEKYPFYLVTKYLEGEDLASRMKREIIPFEETARWLATVARSLHHAHARGLVHRDIKPANILIDLKNEPWILDFGLALRDDQVGIGKALVGTPVYMSPEQARRQGHRIDGRSDIFSLGIVLYEMLCNRKPFLADNLDDLIRQIVEMEPKPPRQRKEAIPRELERICLKALSKHVRDRYQDAAEFSRDLDLWLLSIKDHQGLETAMAAPEPGSGSVRETSGSGSYDQASSVSVRVIPKGLRSFDEEDAEFFLSLLPGPKDRDGLPESLRYWKKRIEAVSSFQVGVIYGPSGCGKSSLVKAGLIPNLDGSKAVTLYLEATAEETEERLKSLVMKSCGLENADISLTDLLFNIRNGGYKPLLGMKLVLVIDQFEQWLHQKNGIYEGALAEALGQCDGTHLQALLMVRDDFWMAITRLIRHLEIDLSPDTNLQGVDLFDLSHSEKVLTALGRGYGKLPEYPRHIRSAQKRFLQKAVEELSQENRVITVRLTLFAEMMKSREWTLESLKSVGGIGGLGVTFLEETFEGIHALPEHRLYQSQCKAILQALLPQGSLEITGPKMRSELLAKVANLSDPSPEFATAIRILEKDLRLVTAVEATPFEDLGQNQTHQAYQITHDYMVSGIREWLLKNQKETARGRAEIMLAERAELWQVKRQSRYLPSFGEYLKILWLTRKNHRSKPQREMMRRARATYVRRGCLVAAVFLAILLGLREWYGSIRAENLTRQLASSRPEQVLPTIRALEPYMAWAKPLLEKHRSGPSDDSAWLPASIALIPLEPDLINEIVDHLPEVDSHLLPVIGDTFRELPIPESLRQRLWQSAIGGNSKADQKLKYLGVLAGCDADSEKWDQVSRFLADQLVQMDAAGFLFWKARLKPAGKAMVPPLMAILADSGKGFQARSFAMEALLDFADKDREALFELLAKAPAELLRPVFARCGKEVDFFTEKAVGEINQKKMNTIDEPDSENSVLRKANLAMFLLNTDRKGEALALLTTSAEPSLRSEIIHGLPKTGYEPGKLASFLETKREPAIQAAILLCLGNYESNALDPTLPSAISRRLIDELPVNQDAALHGAAEWLLRRWGFGQQLDLAKVKIQTADPMAKTRPWRLTSEGLTLMRIPRGVTRLGSSETEEGRAPNETFHQAEIERDLYFSSTEIPRDLFKKYLVENKLPLVMESPFFSQISLSPMDPEVAVSWFDAARFCNWLSKKEGIPESDWCYEPSSLVDTNRDKSAGYTEGMLIRAGYKNLKGYRLPTVAEWEYACRANTQSTFHFGNHKRLLPDYGWFNQNSQGQLAPVYSLKPNDWGLFGLCGNTMEWCQNATVSSFSDDSSPETVTRSNRVFRGGSIGLGSSYCRSAARNSGIPGSHSPETGFRVVRQAD